MDQVGRARGRAQTAWSRRDFLKLVGAAAFLATLPWPGPARGGMLGSLFAGRSRETLPITPNDEFYVTSYRSPPTLRIKEWRLAVSGLVSSPLTLTYDALLSRPSRSQIVTLECIGNTVGDAYIGTAVWEGTSLADLLGEARVDPRSHDVVFRAADGYSDSLPLSRALAGDVLIAHRMNGVPLPEGHGFPARIIVPGCYGMKSVQWLTHIELVEHDYKGYYQRKGWSEEAIVKTMSRIDVPVHGDRLTGSEIVVRGIAFAGSRGVSGVEVSLDGEGRWRPAALEPPQSAASWVLWSYRWRDPSPGYHELTVRATDGQGKLQTDFQEGPAPDGASGLHSITFKVTP